MTLNTSDLEFSNQGDYKNSRTSDENKKKKKKKETRKMGTVRQGGAWAGWARAAGCRLHAQPPLEKAGLHRQGRIPGGAFFLPLLLTEFTSNLSIDKSEHFMGPKWP